MPLRELGHRIGWGVADQLVSSVTNFAIVIVIARRFDAEYFGAFGLAYVTYASALNASRGLATDPLIVRFTGSSPQVWRQKVAHASGLALLVGLLSGAVVVGSALLLSGPARSAMLVLGVCLPGLLVQDSWRFAFFGERRGARAFWNDVVWAACLLLLLGVLVRSGSTNFAAYVLAWGIGAYAAAAVGLAQTRIVPDVLAARQWFASTKDLGLRYLGEGVASSGSNQLRIYGVGVLLGLASVGYVQAVGTVMGPFVIVLTGVNLVIVPEFARLVDRSPRRLVGACLGMAVGLACAALAWGAVLAVALPRGLGDLVLGELWRPVRDLILLGTLAMVLGAFQAAAAAGLRALGDARRSLPAMVFAAVVYVAAGLVGARLGGVDGVMVGAVVAGAVGAAGWWSQLLRSSRSRAASASHGDRAGEADGRAEAGRPAAGSGHGLREGSPTGSAARPH